MKTTKNQVAALGMVLAMLAAGSLHAQTASVLQEWRFGSQANPAAPEVAPASTVAARATVAEGQFASGWIDQDAMLGAGKGIWDLGRKGTITLNQWSADNGAATASHEITVKVTQWFDGGIYGTLATVDVPGARLANRSQAYSVPGTIGDWVTDETHWTIDVGASAESVVVTSPDSGALVDVVSIEAPVPVVVPPTLTIRTLAGENSAIEVSWPSVNASGWQLEASTDVSDAQGWEPVEGQPQMVGDRLAVSVPKQGTLFFRLKHP